MCMREDYRRSELAARPALSLPSHFSLSSFPAPAVFPRGNLICCLPPPLLPSLCIVPTIGIFLVLGDRKRPSASRPLCFPINNPHRCEEQLGGLQKKNPASPPPHPPHIVTAGVTLFSLQCFHHCSVFSSAAPLFIIPVAVSLHPSLISLPVYL